MKNKKLFIPLIIAGVATSLAPAMILVSCGEQNHVVTPTQEQKTAEPEKGSKEAVYSIELLEEALADDMKVEAEAVSNNVTLTGSVVKVENKVVTFKTTLSNAKNTGDININFNVVLSNTKSGWRQTIKDYVFKFKAGDLTAIELNEHEDVEYGLIDANPVTIKSTTPEESKIQSFKYESLDPTIISIVDSSKGDMKALSGAGSARIKLTATDTNGKTATQTIKVATKNTSVSSLTISGSHNIDNENDLSLQFNATDNYGRDQTQYLEWSVLDEKGQTSHLAHFDAFSKGLLILDDDGRSFGGTIVVKAKFGDSVSQTFKADIGSYSMLDIESAKQGIVKAKNTTIEKGFVMPNNYYDENNNPIKLYSIPAYAFKDCTKLEDIHLSQSLTTVDADMFYGCTSLIQLSVDDDNELYAAKKSCLYTKQDIEDSYKKGTLIIGAKNAIIPTENEVTQIGPKAFKNIQLNTTDIDLGSYITTIDESAFEGSNVTTITFGAEKDVTIGKSSFKNCASLTKVEATGANYLASIDQEAFYDCAALTNITIPATCKKIGAKAFKGCSTTTLSIKFVSDTSTATEFVPNWSFTDDNGLRCIWKPSNIDGVNNAVLLAGDTYQENDKKSIGISLDCNDGMIWSNSDFNENYFLVPDVYIYRNATTSHIKEPIRTIKEKGFKDKTCLLYVDLKSSTNSVTTVGANAFSGCTNLQRFRIGANAVLANIGTNAFAFNNGGINKFEQFIDSPTIANATDTCQGLYGAWSHYVYVVKGVNLSANSYISTKYTVCTSPYGDEYPLYHKD